MADSSVAITAGSGSNIDTRTETTNGNHRQVVVLGDPATNSGVAPVDATNGLSVSVTNSTLTTKETRSSTATLSNVPGSASSVNLLSSNSNRLGAVILNDSSAALYVKLGSTASTSSFTVKLYQDDAFEVPANYTGAVDGIWTSATGAARITELT